MKKNIFKYALLFIVLSLFFCIRVYAAGNFDDIVFNEVSLSDNYTYSDAKGCENYSSVATSTIDKDYKYKGYKFCVVWLRDSEDIENSMNVYSTCDEDFDHFQIEMTDNQSQKYIFNGCRKPKSWDLVSDLKEINMFVGEKIEDSNFSYKVSDSKSLKEKDGTLVAIAPGTSYVRAHYSWSFYNSIYYIRTKVKNPQTTGSLSDKYDYGDINMCYTPEYPEGLPIKKDSLWCLYSRTISSRGYINVDNVEISEKLKSGKFSCKNSDFAPFLIEGLKYGNAIYNAVGCRKLKQGETEDPKDQSYITKTLSIDEVGYFDKNNTCEILEGDSISIQAHNRQSFVGQKIGKTKVKCVGSNNYTQYIEYNVIKKDEVKIDLDDSYLDKIQLKKISCDSLFGKKGYYNDTHKLVSNTIKFIQYLGIVLALVLSFIDFIKVIPQQDSKALSKAASKAAIRFGIAVAIFLVPILLRYILIIFGIDNPFCGLI